MTQEIFKLIFNYQMLRYYLIHALKQIAQIQCAYFILMLGPLLSFRRQDLLHQKNYYSIMEMSLYFRGFLVSIRCLFVLFLCLLLVRLERLMHLLYFHFYFDLGLSKSYFLLSLLILGHGMFCLGIILISFVKSQMLVILFQI